MPTYSSESGREKIYNLAVLTGKSRRMHRHSKSDCTPDIYITLLPISVAFPHVTPFEYHLELKKTNEVFLQSLVGPV